MSSLIGWPTLYGNEFVLPALIVGVLLLALLLLVARRKAGRRRSRLATAQGGKVQAAVPAAEKSEVAHTSPEPMRPVAVIPSVETRPVAVTSSVETRPMGERPTLVPLALSQPPLVPRVAAPVVMAVPIVEPAVAPVQAPAPEPSPEPVAEAVVEASAEPAPEPSPMVGLKQLASGKKARLSFVTQSAASAPAARDPLNTTIMDILNGWGDVTPEDEKRLELFRADRLVAALAVMEAPKSKSGDAKARLSQLKQYAADRERRAQAAPAGEGAAESSPAVSMAENAVSAGSSPDSAPAAPPVSALGKPYSPYSVASTAPAVSPPAVAAASSFNFFDEVPSALAAAVGLGVVGGTQAEPDPFPELPREPLVDDYSEAPALGIAGQVDALTDEAARAAEVARAAEIAPLDDVAPVDGVAATHEEPDDFASFWAQPRPLWQAQEQEEPDKPSFFEEVPVPAYDEVEVTPRVESLEDIPVAAVGWEQAFDYADDALAIGKPMEIPAVDAVAEPVCEGQDSYVADEESLPMDPMSRLSIRVETAEQLLALPPQERVDMAAFLEPSELVATFRATNDLELKKAVIDTLEHIGSPASLNALGNCFEDSEAEIQVYALEAADRLLGVV